MSSCDVVRARDSGVYTSVVAARTSEREHRLRRRLGIPDDARHVLVLGESSHWDPNWLFTSEEYYERRIERILDEVLRELQREPRRVFSLEAIFFLRLYWERRPDRRDLLRQLVAERRLQLTGTGITTPDTVIPATEAILRDYLLGQEWLRAHGFEAEPRLAYLPDDFGCSPAWPAILVALGFDRTALTRIDGMYFVGADLRLPSSYPLPGSSAHLLANELRTQDFVWRAPDGSEVLCHWNAFTYFQGDMLAHLGVIRWMGMTLGVPWRTGRHIASRIAGLVRQLAPLSRTPYLFCPIGCDFNGPIERLCELLERYDRTRFGDSGTWVVSAGLDDYLDLVDCHRDSLPVLELDPNPYWMGFYASRPNVKRLSNRIVRKLVLAEKLAFDPARDPAPHDAELDDAWDLVALTNHHDLVTGTSPERVYRTEQLPWLQRAESLADRVLDRARGDAPETRAPTTSSSELEWTLHDGRLDVRTEHYALTITEASGGCLTSYRDATGERLSAPGNDLVAYVDSGGLWRMGHEYLGGRFREIERTSDRPARIDAREADGVLEVVVRARLCGHDVVRYVWLGGGSPIVRMHVDGTAAARRTITCRLPLASTARSLSMNVPGGVVTRPHHKLYDPTFWPARSFAHVEDPAGFGLAVFLGGPACVALTRPGVVEWVVLRHAPLEMAFGVVPLPAHPASGVGTAEDGVEYAVWLTGPGDHRAHHLPREVRRSLRAGLTAPRSIDLDAIASEVMTTDCDDVLVSAIKVASRGGGHVVRLRSYRPGERIDVRLRCGRRAIREARLCDARERDLGPLVVEGGAARVTVERAITSVRVSF
ncbi:putative alpha-mannosidase [Sandaracinus amylolyticus]|uniref:Putative alpha-mannosidase n=1 Tax=Sandaracinus amylolyticus TaxID=927083 RepID=A0A0F6W9J3_9BACT|nr:putative alpha-mannosidase [Sandaracinus amylolyticus]